LTYKTIVVHCDAGPKLAQRLELAVDLAQRHRAHLVGVYVQTPFVAPVFSDGVVRVDVLLDAYRTAAAAAHDQAEVAFTKAVKGSELSTEWRRVEGYPEDELTIQGRYADLVIVGQTDPDELSQFQMPPDLPEVTAISSGRPTLIVPHIGVRSKVGKSVMLCWNASRESAHAATEALPFMVSAERVTVLIVDPRTSASEHGPAPGADVAGWLARHGVKVTVRRDAAADADVGSVILSRASDYEIDLIVMGLYGHSRVREVILGGASRTLLKSMTVPVLMAH
jgi:nucleotide-binding universal stress UspA family protein